jgi:hypothetical protein
MQYYYCILTDIVEALVCIITWSSPSLNNSASLSETDSLRLIPNTNNEEDKISGLMNELQSKNLEIENLWRLNVTNNSEIARLKDSINFDKSIVVKNIFHEQKENDDADRFLSMSQLKVENKKLKKGKSWRSLISSPNLKSVAHSIFRNNNDQLTTEFNLNGTDGGHSVEEIQSMMEQLLDLQNELGFKTYSFDHEIEIAQRSIESLEKELIDVNEELRRITEENIELRNELATLTISLDNEQRIDLQFRLQESNNKLSEVGEIITSKTIELDLIKSEYKELNTLSKNLNYFEEIDKVDLQSSNREISFEEQILLFCKELVSNGTSVSLNEIQKLKFEIGRMILTFIPCTELDRFVFTENDNSVSSVYFSKFEKEVAKIFSNIFMVAKKQSIDDLSEAFRGKLYSNYRYFF